MTAKVLFVCLGNICRSPTAEAVFRKRAQRLQKSVLVDSAGTANWHQGQPPDERTTQTAAKSGYDLSDLRARVIVPEDFHQFDYILAMDRENLANLQKLCPNGGTEPKLFLDFAPDVMETEIPDPYYGGDHGFTHVLHLVEQASDGLLTLV